MSHLQKGNISLFTTLHTAATSKPILIRWKRSWTTKHSVHLLAPLCPSLPLNHGIAEPPTHSVGRARTIIHISVASPAPPMRLTATALAYNVETGRPCPAFRPESRHVATWHAPTRSRPGQGRACRQGLPERFSRAGAARDEMACASARVRGAC